MSGVENGASLFGNNASAASMAPVPGMSERDRAEAAITGIGGHISSRTRTRAEQARLYAKYMRYLAGTGPWAPLAAPPGHSAHETGDALDISYGRGISRQSLAAALDRAGVHYGKILNEGNHFHVPVIDPRRSHGRNAPGGTHSGHINVSVKVTAPPGHQTAVVANGVARGG